MGFAGGGITTNTGANNMSDAEKIARLENTLATLIAWLDQDLGRDNTLKLLDMLSAPKDSEVTE